MECKKLPKKPTAYLKVGVPYQLNLNPPDRYQYLGKANRLYLFRNFVYTQFLSFIWDYTMFIEISEPQTMKQGDAGPRLHLHGIIEFGDADEIKQFLLHDYYKLTRWTRIHIDTIADLSHWIDYCSKQWDLFGEKQILSRAMVLNPKKKKVLKAHDFFKKRTKTS